MSGQIGKAALLGLAIVLVLVVGFVPYVARYRYLCLTEVPGVEVIAVDRVEVENHLFGSEIPLKYSLARERYTVLVSLDRQSHLPAARIELVASPQIRLVPRPWRGARADRPRPCGSYDEIADSGDAFIFSWVICGDDADPGEMVIAFDVVGDAVSTEETLRFRLKRDGVYWLRDSL